MRICFVWLALLALVTVQLTSALHVEDSSETQHCENYEFYSGECFPCSECGPNWYELRECSKYRDTVCGGCDADNPVLNDDFFHKCSEAKPFLKPLRSAIEQIRSGQSLKLENLREEMDSDNKWWMFFYLLLALVLLILLVFSFWSCYAHRNFTRVINVAPPLLNDADNHNIIFAAQQIRDKLTTKRGEVKYEYL